MTYKTKEEIASKLATGEFTEHELRELISELNDERYAINLAGVAYFCEERYGFSAVPCEHIQTKESECGEIDADEALRLLEEEVEELESYREALYTTF